MLPREFVLRLVPVLWRAFLVLAAVGAAWAAFGLLGGSGASLLLVAWLVCGWAKWRGWPWLRLAGIGVGLVGVFAAPVRFAREEARQAHCVNNLKQIAVALNSYRQTLGQYPQPSVFDATGRPMLSWRLAIKPFLDCTPDYNYWDFREPWNSPVNQKLLDRPQYVFRCPSGAAARIPDSPVTSYVALVGHRALRRTDDSFDSRSQSSETAPQSFVLLEMADSGIPWTEPRDLSARDVPLLQALVLHTPHQHSNGYFFHSTPGLNAAVLDGDAVFLFRNEPAANLLASLLPHKEPPRRGGFKEVVDPLPLERPPVHWPHCIGLPVWLFAVVLLIHGGRRRAKKAPQPEPQGPFVPS